MNHGRRRRGKEEDGEKDVNAEERAHEDAPVREEDGTTEDGSARGRVASAAQEAGAGATVAPSDRRDGRTRRCRRRRYRGHRAPAMVFG